MNTHPQQETLSAYIDDMLDVAQMRRTARHLQGCLPCRASCTALRETRDLLRHIPASPAPPREFWTRAYRHVRVNSVSHEHPASLLGQVRQSLLGTQRRWAAGAAAVLVMALAAPLISSQHSASLSSAGTATINAPDVVDLPSLVRDHAQSAAAQPLADSERQTMLSADVDDGPASSDLGTEAAGNGIFNGDAAP